MLELTETLRHVLLQPPAEKSGCGDTEAMRLAKGSVR